MTAVCRAGRIEQASGTAARRSHVNRKLSRGNERNALAAPSPPAPFNIRLNVWKAAGDGCAKNGKRHRQAVVKHQTLPSRPAATGPQQHGCSTEGGRISNPLRPRYRYISTYHTGRITVHPRNQNPWKRSVGYQDVARAFPNGDGVVNTVGSTCSRLHHKGKESLALGPVGNVLVRRELPEAACHGAQTPLTFVPRLRERDRRIW